MSFAAGINDKENRMTNLLAGKIPTFSRPPTYGLTAPNEPGRLTEGLYADPAKFMWASPRAVAWNPGKPVEIIFGLGEERRIGVLSYSTQAGDSNVCWPRAIAILVSSNGVNWWWAGELTEASSYLRPEPANGRHVYSAPMNVAGRYLKLIVDATSYIVCDEITAEEAADGVAMKTLLHADWPLKYLADTDVQRGRRRGMMNDIWRLRTMVVTSKLPEITRDALSLTLLDHQTAVSQYIPAPSDRPSVIPFCPLHEGILAVYATIQRAAGVRNEVIVWQSNRWEPLDYLTDPYPTQPMYAPEIKLNMMQGEYRSEVLCMTNPTKKEMIVSIRRTLPPSVGTMELLEVVFTASTYGRVLADALEVLPYDAGVQRWTVKLPAGMTKQLWVRFRGGSRTIDTTSRLIVFGGGKIVIVPVTIHISKVKFPDKPRLGLTCWDYQTGYDLKPEHVPAAAKDLEAHHVDMVWAPRNVLPWTPNTGQHWSGFDQWIKEWNSNGRQFLIFLNLTTTSTFGTFKPSTPDFVNNLTAWAVGWRQHVLSLGLKAEQVGVLLLDEIRTEAQAAAMIPWLEALVEGYPELCVVQTLGTDHPELITGEFWRHIIKLLVPLDRYDRADSAAKQFYEFVSNGGMEIWLYKNVSTITLEPYWHGRMMAWRAWAHNVDGVGFWSYSDAGGAGSWNPWAMGTTLPYSPVYFSANGQVLSSKHWEAWREGMQDYEYLAMLADRLQERHIATGDIWRLFTDAHSTVLAGDSPRRIAGRWDAGVDRSTADRVRAELLKAIEGLA